MSGLYPISEFEKYLFNSYCFEHKIKQYDENLNYTGNLELKP